MRHELDETEVLRVVFTLMTLLAIFTYLHTKRHVLIHPVGVSDSGQIRTCIQEYPCPHGSVVPELPPELWTLSLVDPSFQRYRLGERTEPSFERSCSQYWNLSLIGNPWLLPWQT
jgi:hypothetical protein